MKTVLTLYTQTCMRVSYECCVYVIASTYVVYTIVQNAFIDTVYIYTHIHLHHIESVNSIYLACHLFTRTNLFLLGFGLDARKVLYCLDSLSNLTQIIFYNDVT